MIFSAALNTSIFKVTCIWFLEGLSCAIIFSALQILYCLLCLKWSNSPLQGFIRNEPFDPKAWIIPGDYTGTSTMDWEFLSGRKIFHTSGRKKIKSKRVADVVEALIGACLESGGESAAISFMEWLGIKVDLNRFPYTMPLSMSPEKLVDIKFFESLLKYKFCDASLLVEALTHGSYMLTEIPRCFQVVFRPYYFCSVIL